MVRLNTRYELYGDYYTRSAVAVGPDTKEKPMDLIARNVVVRADTFDPQTRTVEAVIATESRVMVFDFFTFRIMEEILLFERIKLPDQVPLQDSHNRHHGLMDTIGSNRKIHIEKDEMVATVHFAETEEGQRAFILYRDKDLRSFSIGYRIDRQKAFIIRAGETAVFQGKKYKASKELDLRIVPGEGWQLVENSAVAIPADSRAKTRNNNPNLEDKKMNFKDFCRSIGYDIETYSESDEAYCRKRFETEHGQSSGDDGDGSGDNTPATGDGSRATATAPVVPAVADPVVPAAGDDGARSDPAPLDEEALSRKIRNDIVLQRNKIEDIAKDLVLSEGTLKRALDCETLEQAKDILLKDKREQTPDISAVNFYSVDKDVTSARLQAGFFMRTSQSDIIENKDKFLGRDAFSEQDLDAGRHFEQLSLIDLCRTVLHAEGKSIRGSNDQIFMRAITTTSLPTILGNIAQKSVLLGYTFADPTWQRWCSQIDVKDFKENTGVRLTDVGDLEIVPNSGEVKDGSLSEEFEKFKIDRYSKALGISDVNMINDDTSVLVKVPQGMGMRAGLLNSDLPYKVLLANANLSDGKALFSTDHLNAFTGVPLNNTNLGTGISNFMKQKNKDKKLINVVPKSLIVATENRQVALELTLSDTLITGTGAEKGSKNINKGAVEAVVEARLNGNGFTGESPTTWYLAGDPRIVDTIQVAFLQGKNRRPTLERFDGGPNYHGLKYRVTHDVGAKALDSRGLQRNKA